MASRTAKPTDLARGIRAGDRATLARAITLIESKRADHRMAAHKLVQELLPFTGQAVRLGITGAPGAGKSTTIDALGTYLTGPRSPATSRAWRGWPPIPPLSSAPRPPPARSAALPPRRARPCWCARPP